VKEQNLIFGILVIFLAVQILGLFTASQYIEYFEANPEYEVFENPGDVSNSFMLFGYILAGTVIMLLIIKYWKNFLRYLELIVVFFASEISLEALFPYPVLDIPIAIPLALTLAIWKFKWPNLLNQNIALVFSLAGAGALLGISLEVFPIMIFAAVLSIYDIISVFFTKHMVYMAKAITERPFAFVASIPTEFVKAKKVTSLQTGKVVMKKIHTFHLGGGDLAIPLILSASVLRYFSLTHAIITSIGALIATFFMFSYVLKKPGKPLPALPPITAGAFLAFALSVLFL